jgi:hypothetical protein
VAEKIGLGRDMYYSYDESDASTKLVTKLRLFGATLTNFFYDNFEYKYRMCFDNLLKKNLKYYIYDDFLKVKDFY